MALSNGITSSSSPSPSPSPIKSRQSARLLGPDSVHTEVLCQAFDDRVLVLVTQVGKVGCLTQVSIPSTLPLPPALFSPGSPQHSLPSLPSPPPSLLVQPLLGTAPEEIYSAYVAQIGSLVFYGMGTRCRAEGNGKGDEDEGEGEEGEGGAGTTGRARRPVVVGLALKKLSRTAEEGRTDYEAERRRFGEVMGMVLECRVW